MTAPSPGRQPPAAQRQLGRRSCPLPVRLWGRGLSPPAPASAGSARLEASLGAKRSICCHGQGIASAAGVTKREGSGTEAPI